MTKDESVKNWPDQYWENYQGYPPGAHDEVAKVIAQYANPAGVALDIGCGRGDSTNEFLVPRFKEVLAIDLLENRPANLDPSVFYYRAGDNGYTLHAIRDASIDFVWSFGVFCHLPNSAVTTYLRSIRRVLKPDGKAVIMFANWPRHPGRRSIPNPEMFREVSDATWFYCDVPTAVTMAFDSGFSHFNDLLPHFRDTLAELS